METGATHIEEVGNVVEALDDLGLEPVLVGGMALVVLGSRRVTRDFDLVVARPDAALGQLLDALYDRGFELASRVDAAGRIPGGTPRETAVTADRLLRTPHRVAVVEPGDPIADRPPGASGRTAAACTAAAASARRRGV